MLLETKPARYDPPVALRSTTPYDAPANNTAHAVEARVARPAGPAGERVHKAPVVVHEALEEHRVPHFARNVVARMFPRLRDLDLRGRVVKHRHKIYTDGSHVRAIYRASAEREATWGFS